MFFGLAEPEGNRRENFVSIVDEFCEDHLGSQDIVRPHRIGRKISGEFRPVVVYSSFSIREKISSNAFRSGGTRFGIQE